VGDSRIYRLRNSHLEQITEDQSLVWELYRNGSMTKEEIRKHPRNNIVTCALGIESNMLISSIESYQLDIKEKDIFMLCSDGLSDMLSDDELEEILLKNISLDKKAGLLIDAANNNGGKDNISVILVEI
jgi:protein phosphatase